MQRWMEDLSSIKRLYKVLITRLVIITKWRFVNEYLAVHMLEL